MLHEVLSGDKMRLQPDGPFDHAGRSAQSPPFFGQGLLSSAALTFEDGADRGEEGMLDVECA